MIVIRVSMELLVSIDLIDMNVDVVPASEVGYIHYSLPLMTG